MGNNNITQPSPRLPPGIASIDAPATGRDYCSLLEGSRVGGGHLGPGRPELLTCVLSVRSSQGTALNSTPGPFK